MESSSSQFKKTKKGLKMINVHTWTDGRFLWGYSDKLKGFVRSDIRVKHGTDEAFTEMLINILQSKKIWERNEIIELWRNEIKK